MNEKKLFYIRDRRQVVGNCVSWWCPDGKGYTCDLAKAGLYKESYGKTLRDTDEMVPEHIARAVSDTHVRVDPLDQAMEAYRHEAGRSGS